MDPLHGLNPQQRIAVEARPGPTLVLAGPGSGKTRVLTQRIVYLINTLGVPAYRILAVTFTNKAANEMKARVQRLLGGPDGQPFDGLMIGTFHSICARWLRREADALAVTRDFVIFDTSDQEALVRQVLQELNLDEKKNRPAALLGRISAAKNELVGPDEYPAGSYAAEVVRRVYQAYQQALVANNALDFDDLLVYAVRLFREHPDVLARYQRNFEHVLVDEFQDTNTVQYALLCELTAGRRNLYAVGDPDQSVYRWRGADYRNVRRFQQDFPDHQLVLLEQNYRSTQLILDAAMAVIDKHPARTRKQLFTERGSGAKVTVHEAYSEQDEAQFVVDTIQELVRRGEHQRGDFAVMYRTNAQSRAVEEAFVHSRLPYRLVGAQRFYGRKEVKDLLAYLRLVHNPADSVSLLRVINTPARGIGAKTLEQLQEAARAAGLTPVEVLRDLAEAGPRSEYAPRFGAKAAATLGNFGLMLQHWLSARAELSVLQLFDTIVERISYRGYLLDGSDEGQDRWENVLELRGTVAEHPDQGLAEFLQDVALLSDQDTLAGEGQGAVLLTLHAAKGLEFPVVFIVGLDEGVLPHQRSFDDPEAMHEERRLMYVGMTRAQDRLYLLRAFRRSLYGDSSVSQPSRFLDDIPDSLLDSPQPARWDPRATSLQRQTRWESPPGLGKAGPAPGPAGRGPAPRSPQQAAPRPDSTFRTGQRVQHASFGEGIVIESRGSGADEEVTIAFEAVGIKRLLAGVANLKLLPG